jgi:ferredoxin
MRINVDMRRCIGAGQCVLAAPDVFDQDDDGLVRVLAPQPGVEHEESVRQADLHCPSGTITLSRD